MKTLKMKIFKELESLEHHETLTDKPIRRDVLDHSYKLSKTLCYLEKAEKIMEATEIKEAEAITGTKSVRRAE